MGINEGARALIVRLGRILGVPGLEPDADGGCSWVRAGMPTINFAASADDDVVRLYCDLGVPAAGGAIYEQLLKANAVARASGRPTLGLTGDEPPHVMLVGVIEAGDQDVATTYDIFSETLVEWTAIVSGIDHDDDDMETGVRPGVEDVNLMIRA